jgi:hypothetical protein
MRGHNIKFITYTYYIKQVKGAPNPRIASKENLLKVNFSFIFPLALCAVVDIHIELRRTTMVVEEHEKPLMQLVVLCKLGPSAPEVHLAAPIIVHLHLIWSSASRLFAEDSFPELAPVHEFCELQRNTLLLTALSTSDAEERINLGRRRRRGIVRSSAGT